MVRFGAAWSDAQIMRWKYAKLLSNLANAVEALREVGLAVRTAVCVVDREEGGTDALARQAVRLRPIFRSSDLLGTPKIPAKPHG